MNIKGYTLVETMLSATLLVVVLFGGIQYLYVNRWDAEKGVRDQLAWTNMATRMAKAAELDYNEVLDTMPETSVPLLLGGNQGYRTTVVNLIDDPFDGVAPMDTSLPDYLEVMVMFAWFNPENITDTLRYSISAERGWHY